MRTIDGHFTVVNEPGTARALAANLLHRFESMRSPEHIVITESTVAQAAGRAQGVLANSLTQSIALIDKKIAELPQPDKKSANGKIENAQRLVLELTNRAERVSSSKNWRKLDQARKQLSKELEKAGFSSYTQYVDHLNSNTQSGNERRELLMSRDALVAKKAQAEKESQRLDALTPAQVITVLADVLSRCPRTPMGPLPIVIDDALRHLNVSAKLRAMDVLKAHSAHYATWYVTDDPVVLSWAGFDGAIEQREQALFDYDTEIAS